MKKRQAKKIARNILSSLSILKLAHKLYPIEVDKFFNHKIALDIKNKLTLYVWDNERWIHIYLVDNDTLKTIEQKLKEYTEE